MVKPDRSIVLPGMVLVSGCCRNVGKTTLCCEIIEHLSKTTPVVAIKISNGFIGDKSNHGTHTVIRQIYRETDTQGNKDTMRFLRAGAMESWLLQSDDKTLPQRFLTFLKQIDPNRILVCESNALAAFVRPGVYVRIAGERDDKPVFRSPDVILNPMDISGFRNFVRSLAFRENRVFTESGS